MVALGRRLKEGHVITQRPNQVVVLSYDAVGRHCRYERNIHFDAKIF